MEASDLGSVEAKLIRQNCPLKAELTGNLLQCLQVNYSVLKNIYKYRLNIFVDLKYMKKKKNRLQTHLLSFVGHYLKFQKISTSQSESS